MVRFLLLLLLYSMFQNYATASNLNEEANFDGLPKDVKKYIMFFLDDKSLFRASETCKYLDYAVNQFFRDRIHEDHTANWLCEYVQESEQYKPNWKMIYFENRLLERQRKSLCDVKRERFNNSEKARYHLQSLQNIKRSQHHPFFFFIRRILVEEACLRKDETEKYKHEFYWDFKGWDPSRVKTSLKAVEAEILSNIYDLELLPSSPPPGIIRKLVTSFLELDFIYKGILFTKGIMVLSFMIPSFACFCMTSGYYSTNMYEGGRKVWHPNPGIFTTMGNFFEGIAMYIDGEDQKEKDKKKAALLKESWSRMAFENAIVAAQQGRPYALECMIHRKVDMRSFDILVEEIIQILIRRDLEEGLQIYDNQYLQQMKDYPFEESKFRDVMNIAKELAKMGHPSIFKRLCLHYHYKVAKLMEYEYKVENFLENFNKDIKYLGDKAPDDIKKLFVHIYGKCILRYPNLKTREREKIVKHINDKV